MEKSFLSKLKGKYWLFIGILTYVSVAVSSIIRSLDGYSFFDNVYLSIDWFASCTYYFFFGAAIGLIFDFYFARKSNKKFVFPLWLGLTLSLWIVSSATSVIIANPNVNVWLSLFFPLAFSIFFTGYAFIILFPDYIVHSYLGKLFFDIAFLSIFFSWIYLSWKNTNRKKLLNLLVIIVFLVLFLGFSGCAIDLAK